jgi:hypothetical protein
MMVLPEGFVLVHESSNLMAPSPIALI